MGALEVLENVEHLLEGHMIEEGADIGGYYVFGALVADSICANATPYTEALHVGTKAADVRLQ